MFISWNDEESTMIRCLIRWMSWCGFLSVFYAIYEFETILVL